MSTQEFKVGQQVSGTDYERLPLGSEVKYGDVHVFIRTKVAPNRWARNGMKGDYSDNRGMARATNGILITLPDATQPEDATDAYVEPEPLKEGDPDAVTINTLDREEIDRFARALPAHWSLVNENDTIDSEVINDLQAALREFANPKPSVCPSLHHVADEGVYVRCEGFEGHTGSHTAMFSPGFKTWLTDDGRITEGGAS